MGLYLARPGLRKAAIAKQTPAQRKAAKDKKAVYNRTHRKKVLARAEMKAALRVFTQQPT